jgi:hypothetical protein
VRSVLDEQDSCLSQTPLYEGDAVFPPGIPKDMGPKIALIKPSLDVMHQALPVAGHAYYTGDRAKSIHDYRDYTNENIYSCLK